MTFYSKALVFFGILSTGIHSFVKEYSVCLWFPNALGFPGGLAEKESPCNVGDLDSIPGLGRSPGDGKGYPLQYSALENSIDCICIVHGVAKSRTRMSDFHFCKCII